MTRIFITVLLSAITVFAVAQTRSGDSDLDRDLTSIDAEAKLSFNNFKVELSKTYAVSAPKIDYLKVEIGMSGGDIYMTLELARITGRSIDIIVDTYKSNKGQGWGVIAKELGIKPGSPEFHQLKSNAKSKGKNNPGKGKGKGNGKGKG